MVAELATVKAERDELKKWKEEMTYVDAQWELQRIAKLLGMLPGVDIRKNIEPKLVELLSKLEASERACAEMKKALNEWWQKARKGNIQNGLKDTWAKDSLWGRTESDLSTSPNLSLIPLEDVKPLMEVLEKFLEQHVGYYWSDEDKLVEKWAQQALKDFNTKHPNI